METNRRVVMVHWKKRGDNVFEVFSNLKNVCLSYPQYNYNTLNNYLGKQKIAYENDDVYIERKDIIYNIKRPMRIVPFVRKAAMASIDESAENLEYWMKQPVRNRLAALTFIVFNGLKSNQRMDRTIIEKRKMKV